MKRLVIAAILPVCCFLYFSCSSKRGNDLQPGINEISAVRVRMTDLMIHDVTNPPLATRFYAYAFLAGYEVIAENDSSYKSMVGWLKDYPVIPKPPVTHYSYRLASLFAMLETAGKIQPSGKLLDAQKKALADSCLKKGMGQDEIDSSRQYGQYVAKAILAYAKKDGYNKVSYFPRYTPLRTDSNWYPTPPGFFTAVEPYFNKLRPFFLDSCSQFKPLPPVSFNPARGSGFYKLMNAVYLTGKSLTDSNRAIAAFWDCNPFAIQDQGHLQYGLKKISPGAHWMGITSIACRKANVSFERAMQIHALVAVTLMDAFICCWDEKYRSNRIRPETVIRRYLDDSWNPLLQTPPFPEYLSGHSVISAASAEVLTHFFGEPFHFTDSIEVPFGLPPRDFSSFRQAASEAGISRFYGGIHFTDAVEEGLVQGRKVGEHVVKVISN